jgi:hypothetical protein
MLVQTAHKAPLVERVSSDPVLEKVAIGLAVAVAGLIAREVYAAYQARRRQRARDRAIVSALLRELAVIAGVTRSIGHDVNRERTMIAQQGHWRLKPLLRFPAGVYELVRGHIPDVLLTRPAAVRRLLMLQMQCEYANSVAEEHQKWKTPDARGQPDQIDIIVSFHESIMESVNAVAAHCRELQPLVMAAGEKLGGLNLEGPIAREARRWKRTTQRIAPNRRRRE